MNPKSPSWWSGADCLADHLPGHDSWHHNVRSIFETISTNVDNQSIYNAIIVIAHKTITFHHRGTYTQHHQYNHYLTNPCPPAFRCCSNQWRLPLALPWFSLQVGGCGGDSDFAHAPRLTSMTPTTIISPVPVYFICIQWKSKPRWFSSSLENLTITLQRLLVVLPPDKED